MAENASESEIFITSGAVKTSGRLLKSSSFKGIIYGIKAAVNMI